MFKKPGFRVGIRPLLETDINDRYASWFKNYDGHLDYYSGSGYEMNKDDLIRQLKDSKKKKDHFFYAIVHLEPDLLIGSIKIGPISHRHKTADLVTLIGDRNFIRRGLAKEAISLGNAIAFEELNLRKLYSGMYAENKASINAYLASGWVIEGVMKGQYWVNGKPMDRIMVACFNPRYFKESR